MKMEHKEFDVLTSVCKICHQLYTSSDLDKALETLSSAAISVLEAKGCSVKMLNERHTKLDIYVMQGFSDRFKTEVGPYEMFRSSFNQEAIKGNPIFIEDIEKEEEFELTSQLKQEGIRALASLPVRIKDKVIGVFSIYFEKPHRFDRKEKAFLNTMATQGAAVINSLRNFRRMKTLLDVGKIINSSLDLDYVLNEIVNQAAKTMKCRAASIRILNESTNRLVFKTSYGLSKEYLDIIPRTLEQSPIDRRVLEDKDVVYVEDLTTDSRVGMGPEAAKENLTSMLCAPLVFQDKSIGILKIYTTTRTRFTTEEIQFMRSLAELSATAIRNASFYEKLHSLYQVTSSLSSTLETNRVLDLLCIHAADYLKAAGAQVLVWDKDKDKFTARTAYNMDKEFVDSLALTRDSWSTQQTLQGNTIIVSNIKEDDRLEIREAALKAGINSMVSVPLKTMDRISGVLQIYCRIPRNFTSDEIEFLTTLANHGAISLENAKMHEHFKSEYEKLIDDIYVWHDWTSYVIRE